MFLGENDFCAHLAFSACGECFGLVLSVLCELCGKNRRFGSSALEIRFPDIRDSWTPFLDTKLVDSKSSARNPGIPGMFCDLCVLCGRKLANGILPFTKLLLVRTLAFVLNDL